MHIRAAIAAIATAGFLASPGGLPAFVVPAAGAECTITGTAGTDTLSGTGGTDVICGLGGADTISGRAGDDILIGGAGSDTLVGGAGGDTLSGGAGNDSLSGADGIDSLNGGTGADSMTGGAGVDTATYAGSTTPVVADLDGAAADDGTTGERDTLGSGIEGIAGGTADDELTGSTAANTLIGGAGSDTLVGGAGGDTLSGGAGNDSLSGADGIDSLNGGTGADSMTGGAGVDTATYAGSTTPVVADLDGAAADDGTTGERDTLGSGIEGITGGTADDELTGSTAANTLIGGAGSDTLVGGAGGDTLSGGAGNDSAYGGAGVDTLSLGDGTNEVADASGGTPTSSGGESCIAADQDLEIAVGCATVGGYGQYGRTSLVSPHDLSTHANLAGLLTDQPDLGMHAGVLPDGSTVVAYKDSSGNPVITKVLESGMQDTSFGDNGWVTDLSQRAGQAQVVSHVTGLVVIAGQAFVVVTGEVTYMAKFDSTGQLDPAFGTQGILDLGPALGATSCRLCGFYPMQAFDDRLMLGYNRLNTEGGFTWSHGFAEINTATGATVSNSVASGLVDGDLPRSVLPLPEGTVLRQSHTGAVYKHTSTGEADAAFGSEGVLAAPVFDTTGNRGINSTELLPAANGFARVTVVGTLEPLGPGGVPKIYETQQHELIVETFDATGQPSTTGDNEWVSTVVELPPGVEECDTAASPANLPTSVMSLNGNAGAPDVLTLQRCSDDLWVTLLPDGTATIERRDRGNFRGTPGTVVDPSGRLLVYGTGAALTLERLTSS